MPHTCAEYDATPLTAGAEPGEAVSDPPQAFARLRHVKVVVPAETRSGERRVAAVPESVGRLVKAGLEVVVETGAGRHAFIDDAAYVAAGATTGTGDVLAGAEVVLHVSPLTPEQIARLARGAVTIGFQSPATNADGVRAARDAGVTALGVELLPRISRAQSMDALTSQALVSGYRAALVAADRLPMFFPLLMTAAGTIKPAKVLVLGAGVAGLQAIATAKRLGAVVYAYDVRAASADEVRSMGAKFVELDLEALEGTGGYAREMSDDRATRQRELLAPFVADADAVITTAAVPGRPAPLLVTGAMVEAMKPGSVVVDLAAETGGNVEGVVAGEEIVIGGTTVWGGRDVPSQMPVHASRLYARNVSDLLAAHDQGGRRRPRLGGRDHRRLLGHARRRGPRGGGDVSDSMVLLTIFVLSVFVGFEVISKVSTTLHTPLMSGANAIHGVILVGAIIVTGQAHGNVELVLGLVAVVLATVNMVGGFVVTDRMLRDVQGSQAMTSGHEARATPGSRSPTSSPPSASSSPSRGCRRRGRRATAT